MVLQIPEKWVEQKPPYVLVMVKKKCCFSGYQIHMPKLQGNITVKLFILFRGTSFCVHFTTNKHIIEGWNYNAREQFHKSYLHCVHLCCWR